MLGRPRTSRKASCSKRKRCGGFSPGVTKDMSMAPDSHTPEHMIKCPKNIVRVPTVNPTFLIPLSHKGMIIPSTRSKMDALYRSD